MAVTMWDVAKAAGTSVATVSKVLNGSHTISEETAQRVLRTVKAMGYEPNARAQHFAKRRTHTVYFLTRLMRDSAFTNPHMFEILSGAQAALDAKGYALCVKGIAPADACALVKSLDAQRAADGIMVHASVLSKRLAALLPKLDMAHLLIGQPNVEGSLCWIDTNNILAGEIAARHLLERGYAPIAFIGGKPDDMISWHRLRGVRQAIETQGVLLLPGHVRQADSTYQDGFRVTRQMLRQARPRAIICANNLIALGCVEAIRALGLRIPDDIAVMTFDTYPYAHITDPKLTVVDVNMFDMGKQAGKWMLEAIRKPNLQVQAFTTLPELIVGGTTGEDR